MSRTRQVFPRDTVAHLWANKGQDAARDAGGNFYFVGPALYSYGTHFVIGHILSAECGPELAGRVLWNDDSHSNTTSKHQTDAWRALSRQQNEMRIFVPGLTQDTARNIERRLIAKQLPDCTDALLSRVCDAVSSLAGKKHGGGPFENAVFEARKFETTACLFYTRAGRKYPLPAVPEWGDVPADKLARAEFILQFARPLIEKAYRKPIDEATGYLKSAQQRDEGFTGFPHTDMRTRLSVTGGTYNEAQRCEKAAHAANTQYALLHGGKKSAAANRILRDVAPLLARSKAAYEQAQDEQNRADFARAVRGFYYQQRKNRFGGKYGNFYVTRFAEQSLPDYLERIGVKTDSVEGIAGKRMGALLRAESRVTHAGTVKYCLDRGDDYYDNGNPAAGKYADAAYQYRAAVKHATAMPDTPHTRYLLAPLQEGLARARGRLAGIEAQIAEQNAQRIEDWISGISNTRPAYEAGTFARINGGHVETTRGASVPIEHACRLARVFDRVVSAGGKTWTDGVGPMVGHYRVNAIGADGSLVIGCHEFSPVEAKRLRDVLAQCLECAGGDE